MNTILFVVAVILLVIGLGVKFYGMYWLANKNIPEEERLERYKKTIPITYGLLVPTVAILVYLIATR